MSAPAIPLDSPVSKTFIRVLFAVILALFVVRNLPWHLDDLDQAKQAFVSYQMVEDGKWLLQNTPRDEIATKPPLQGWISAGLYLAAGKHGWEFAWRLPPFIAALAILRQLWKTGRDLHGSVLGSILAVGVFALNSYVPRLATLVRTDMLLTALIFFTGWLILQKLRTDTAWTTRERLALFLLLLGSAMTKGPIAYAFLVPGMLAYLWISRKSPLPRQVFCGWLWWLLPMVVFGGWLALGLRDPEFKKQVIDHEFLGRFTVGETAQHHNLAPGAYTLGILARTLPWTIALLGIFAFRSVRVAVKRDPALLWLVCWTLGGLLFMELVPSKRFDRILPVIPPMALLLAAGARHLPEAALLRRPNAFTVQLITIIGMLGATGYTALVVTKAFQTDQRVLVRFGETVKDELRREPGRLAVCTVKDEGLAMYCGVPHFTRFDDAVRLWNDGDIQYLVLDEADFRKHGKELRNFDPVAEVPLRAEKADAYRLLRKSGAKQVPSGEAPTPSDSGKGSSNLRENGKANSAPETHSDANLRQDQFASPTKLSKVTQIPRSL